MNDDTLHKFASWPFRYYVTFNKEIKLIGEPNDSWFDLSKLFEYLRYN